MKTFGIVVICLAVGFATGFKTSLVREHNRLERNKQILRRIHKEVWSNPDLNADLKAADGYYTPGFIFHDASGDSYGLANWKKGIAEGRSAMPDYKEDVLEVVAEGDVVVTRFLATGTQKGDLPATPGYMPVIPANCKPIRVPALAIFHMVDGRIAEQWESTDTWLANIQAGLIDPDKMTFKPASACR